MPRRLLSIRVLMCTLMLVLLAIFGSFLAPRLRASALTSPYLNFQARLLTSAGAIVPDGNYHIEFKLYNASSSSGSSQGSCTGDSNCLWTETRSTGNLVRVVNGYVTANLGSVNSFPSTINWDQQLWITMNIGGTAGSPSWDGETSPRLQLTAVPYAFKAGQLAQYNSGTGFTSTLKLAQPTVGNQIFQIADQGAAGTYNVCIQSSSSCGFATGSGVAFVQSGNSFGTAAILGTQDNQALTFITNNSEKARLTTGGVLQINSTGTPGTVEKLRVNTPTTTDNAAGVIISASAAANKGLVVQGAPSQSGKLIEAQNSSGTELFSVSSNGIILVGTLGTADTNTTLCRNGSNQIATCSAPGAGSAFVQGGNSFGALAVLGTTDSNALQIITGSGSTARMLVANSNNVYFGNAGSAGTASSPNSFTLNGTGSSTAGTAGGSLTVVAGAGTTTGAGSVGGDLTLQGGSAGGANRAGGALTLAGGRGTGTGAGGNILLQVAAAGSSGSTNNSLTTVGTVSATNGSLAWQPVTDSTTTLNIKDSSGNNILTVDTSSGRLGVNLDSSNLPAAPLEVKGSIRLSGLLSGNPQMDHFVTPVGSSVETAINIALYDPGTNGQNVALGIPVTADSTSRAVSLFDARTSAHQPTLAVFSPNENTVVGFTWDGSNTIAKVKTNDRTTTSSSSSAVTLQSGNVTGNTSNTGNVSIVTGNATNGTAGNISMDVGTSSTGSGSISIGTTNSAGVTVGRTGQTNTLNGSVVITDSQASNYVARIQNTNTGTSASGLLVDLGIANASRTTSNYFVGFAGAGTVAGKIQGGASAVAYTTTGADYAEYFKANPENMPLAGELVMLDQTHPRQVLKSSSPVDSPLVGVVSTSPGFVGNGPLCNVDDKDCDKNYAKYNALVALSGQVPARVDASNGPINTGDPITASTTPGVGAKAIGNNYIIGYAMESLTTGSGTVHILIRPQYTGTGASSMQGESLSVADNAKVGGDLNISGHATIPDLSVTNTIETKKLMVKGTIYASDLTIAKLINTQDLKVSNVIATKILRVQENAEFEGDVILSGAINTKQNAITKKFKASGAIQAGSVVVLDGAADGFVTTTTIPQDTKIIGVAVSSTSNKGEDIMIAIGGQVQVEVTGTIVSGDLLVADNTVGAAKAESNPHIGSVLGKATSQKDANHRVWAILTLE